MIYATERPRRYILLDRDGTVIVEKNYLADPAGVELLPGAGQGLRLLRDKGFGLILVTNQSGIGRGKFTFQNLARVHERLTEILKAEGVVLEGIYSCPHAPELACDCRKPKPKLALDAARDFGFDLRDSWVIGDKPADVELAQNCGARSILVRTGYGAESEAAADFFADDLMTAAELIISKGSVY